MSHIVNGTGVRSTELLVHVKQQKHGKQSNMKLLMKSRSFSWSELPMSEQSQMQFPSTGKTSFFLNIYFPSRALHKLYFCDAKPFYKRQHLRSSFVKIHPLLCVIAKLSSSFKSWTRKSRWDIWEVSFPHPRSHWLTGLSCWSYQSNLRLSLPEGNGGSHWSENVSIGSGGKPV